MVSWKACEIWQTNSTQLNWDDDGKRVVLVTKDDRVVFGLLYADDFFFAGEEDGPLFSVTLIDGTDMALTESRLWRFV